MNNYAWPEEVYERVLFNLWEGMESKSMQQNAKAEIEANFPDCCKLEVIFELQWAKSDEFKLLNQIQDALLEQFDEIIVKEDYIKIYIEKEKLLNKFEWICEHFFKIEVEGREFILWVL